MLQITSHTIVKNGMPFIGKVLRQAEPLMTKMLITISEKSTDGTIKEVAMFAREFSDKVEVATENVKSLVELTQVRQDQVTRTSTDWILFLDDDDYWPYIELESCIEQLNDAVDGLGVNPYHLLDYGHYDSSWEGKKWFTKFFRNQDITYRGDWPQDWIYKGETRLYWKDTPRVLKVPFRFYHLANLKPYSFRLKELQRYAYKLGYPAALPKPFKP